MFEQLALEVAKALQDAPCDDLFGWDDVNGWTREKSEQIVEAILKKISGMDGYGVEVSVWSETVAEAILSERTWK